MDTSKNKAGTQVSYSKSNSTLISKGAHDPVLRSPILDHF